MLKNYLKLALRNLKKNKAYAAISISGLAVGFAICFVITLFVINELNYDRFNTKAENLYRVYQPLHPYHSPLTAGLLKENFREIKQAARILVRGELLLKSGDKLFKEKKCVFADPEFFKMFSYKFKTGNPSKALSDPLSIVITERAAEKYFGNNNPVGKILTLENSVDYRVTAVIENMPAASHLQYDYIFTLKGAENIFGAELFKQWGWQNFLVYLEMEKAFDKPSFERKISGLINSRSEKYIDAADYKLQNIRDIHLFSNIENDIDGKSDITYVMIFSCIGLLILIIACFNYINLITANATVRNREIGIRKTIGASSKHLAFQFVGESLIVILFSVSLSLMILYAILPVFNNMLDKSLILTDLFSFIPLITTVTIVLLTAVLGGFYPAFILAKVEPLKVLKNAANIQNNKLSVRNLLVGAQFVVVAILISGVFIMNSQINFLKDKKLGFNKEFTIVSEYPSKVEEINKFESLKNSLLKLPGIKYVSAASRVPSEELNNEGGIQLTGSVYVKKIPYVHVYWDYFQAFGINPKFGRLFSENFGTDKEQAVIINESAVRHLGIKGNPVGQTLNCAWPASVRKIVGVVNDLNFESLYETVKPSLFVIDYSECYKLIIKMKGDYSKEFLDEINSVCKSYYPDWVFEFNFLNDKLDTVYEADFNTFKLMGYFTLIAVILSCMGLFGVTLFIIRNKTKEIGIRKVLGASVNNIVLIISKDFIKWIAAANIIAWPLSWWAVNLWLQNFAYTVDITPVYFIVSGLIVCVIALMTVSFHIIKAASANPINSIKYE